MFPPSKAQSHGGGGGGQKGRKIPLKGNGRRIDYILYSDEGLQPDWKLVSAVPWMETSSPDGTGLVTFFTGLPFYCSNLLH